MGVTCSTKAREPPQKSLGPFDITSAYRICEVSKLNSKETTHFAQVLNSPTSGSRTKFAIRCVYIGALFNQELGNGTVPTEGRVVKSRRAEFVSQIDEFRMIVKESPDVFQRPSFGRINELFKFRHKPLRPAFR